MRTFFPFDLVVSLPKDSWFKAPEVLWPFVSSAVSKDGVVRAIKEFKRPRRKTEHPIILAEKWKELLESNPALSVKEIALHQGFSEPRINQLLRLATLESSILNFLRKLSNPKDICFYGEKKLRELVPLNHHAQIEEFVQIREMRESQFVSK